MSDSVNVPGSCRVAGSTECSGYSVHGMVAGWSGRQRGHRCADSALLPCPGTLHKCAHPCMACSSPKSSDPCHARAVTEIYSAHSEDLTLGKISLSDFLCCADRSADVKHCYTMRHALSLLDFEDETIGDLKRLLLRAAFSPTFLRCKEGRRYLAHLFTLEVCPIAS